MDWLKNEENNYEYDVYDGVFNAECVFYFYCYYCDTYFNYYCYYCYYCCSTIYSLINSAKDLVF